MPETKEVLKGMAFYMDKDITDLTPEELVNALYFTGISAQGIHRVQTKIINLLEDKHDYHTVGSNWIETQPEKI
jgi:hypothetical protein